MVLGNKIDKPKSVSEDEFRQSLGLNGLTTGKTPNTKVSRQVETFMVSIQQGHNLNEAFTWLQQVVVNSSN